MKKPRQGHKTGFLIKTRGVLTKNIAENVSSIYNVLSITSLVTFTIIPHATHMFLFLYIEFLP